MAQEISQEPLNEKDGVTFVISNRRSGLRSKDAVKRSRDAFDASFASVLEADANVLKDIAPPEEDSRRVVVMQGDPNDIAQKMAQMPPDVLIEVYQPRYTMEYQNLMVAALDAAVGTNPVPTSTGARLTLHVKVGDDPARDSKATVYLQSKQTPEKLTVAVGTSNAAGDVTVEYDSGAWLPVAAHIEPAADAWDIVLKPVVDGQSVSLPTLKQNGPVGWWGSLSGAVSNLLDNGKGIRIGVVDTGVGPHPYLQHVSRIGSFLRVYNSDPNSALDVAQHGTHVTGIMAARPTEGSDFIGIAAGAEVFVARVFPDGQTGAGQGDIAMAIEALAIDQSVDLINLSLGGGPSMIEADAIQVALEHGTLCLAAAGNNNGGPVLYPAALANVAAISAVGVPGTIPAGAVGALNQPSDPGRWSPLGVYLATFSNVGPQIAATAAGDGIVSTVPASQGYLQPYLPMSGTSMACPVATATLAVNLAKNEAYKSMNRDAQRALMARQILQSSLLNLNMPQIYQGGGLIRQV